MEQESREPETGDFKFGEKSQREVYLKSLEPTQKLGFWNTYTGDQLILLSEMFEWGRWLSEHHWKWDNIVKIYWKHTAHPHSPFRIERAESELWEIFKEEKNK